MFIFYHNFVVAKLFSKFYNVPLRLHFFHKAYKTLNCILQLQVYTYSIGNF
ncbi:hypothetical protein AAJ76_1970003738 [Vairimorpha ceranae]|uniref:Uncharacterized protein n=1 Tax=Vairimorpha ceranae TaxID=40302 RepID=A0A0F9Z7E1_9MICR|nr:hypothetical protein AAJ76_1970003738 [Vairimorpha ceranae]KKO73864.1 hypothetical protein AAJ76_1970003738 [Vairimorpha ceranae]